MKRYKHQDAKLTSFQRQVAIGSLLGDMSASMPSNGANYHLSCYHSTKQADWLEMKWEWLQPYSRPIQWCAYADKRDGKTRKGGRFHTISAPCFSGIATLFYPNGKKIIPDNLPQLMYHPVALACLICDDGSWDGAGISIASKQFSTPENEILANTLEQGYGIIAGVNSSQEYPFVRIPAASVETTRDLCLPFMPEIMLYKFGGIDYTTTLTGKITKSCPICGKSFKSYESANQKYCSPNCAAIGRPSGYEQNRPSASCPICHKPFIQYMKTQETCTDCRDKPFPHEVCQLCSKPVKKRGRKFCSHRCQVIASHISQGHTIHT